jgi:energy-coupling factor transporter ATP-binding protein EcfA2
MEVKLNLYHAAFQRSGEIFSDLGLNTNFWCRFLEKVRYSSFSTAFLITGTEGVGKTIITNLLSGILLPDKIISSGTIKAFCEFGLSCTSPNRLFHQHFLPAKTEVDLKYWLNHLIEYHSFIDEDSYPELSWLKSNFSVETNKFLMPILYQGVLISTCFPLMNLLKKKKRRLWLLDGTDFLPFVEAFRQLDLISAGPCAGMHVLQLETSKILLIPIIVTDQDDCIRERYLEKRLELRVVDRPQEAIYIHADAMVALNRTAEKYAVKSNSIWLHLGREPMAGMQTIQVILSQLEKPLAEVFGN